ncbi:MAG TPA: serine hydrolase domain-containing protein [Vicinamibacteria bacterium]|nr:serine hydrolase domain-containing protein [Vicinamibacteria bacterium]
MLRYLPLWAAVVALPAGADGVDHYVLGVMEKRKIPGVSIAVVKNGRVERAQGYGLANVELDVKASADTVYQSGSVGKQFTAAGVLLLVEDGKLSLDDRLSKHFRSGPASWHRISIRHLLTHTSGLKDYEGGEEIDMRRDYTEAELLKAMMKLPLEFEPGTQWSYSNSGYLILGLLTSKLAGKHWGEFQKERIFDPLGMATTRVISEKDIVKNRAAGYVLDDKRELKNQDWVASSLNTLADGSLYFTVKDLAAWETALHARRFLKPASFEAWWTPAPLKDGTTFPYGFGWAIVEQRGQHVIGHGGSWQGFRTAILRYVDQGLTVIVLANLAEAEPETMAQEIAGLLDPALKLPDASRTAEDPDPGRAAKLRSVLAAWADSRQSPEMAKGLAGTQSGSAREAGDRARTGERLKALTAFRYLGADDLSQKPLTWRGESVTRIVYYALDTKEARHVYRFYLTQDGRVADFGSEER